jgi:hypothetical protein
VNTVATFIVIGGCLLLAVVIALAAPSVAKGQTQAATKPEDFPEYWKTVPYRKMRGRKPSRKKVKR